ncbi:MAG TPA: hypothetical protein VJB16_03720 [archaeon]|nr:hypothetical protein [archaeon]
MPTPRGFYKNTRSNVIQIYHALKAGYLDGRDYLTVGEIARLTKLHKWTVSRTIDLWMKALVEVTIPEELEGVGVRLKLVKLINPNLPDEKVLRILSVRL